MRRRRHAWLVSRWNDWLRCHERLRTSYRQSATSTSTSYSMTKLQCALHQSLLSSIDSTVDTMWRTTTACNLIYASRCGTYICIQGPAFSSPAFSSSPAICYSYGTDNKDYYFWWPTSWSHEYTMAFQKVSRPLLPAQWL